MPKEYTNLVSCVVLINFEVLFYFWTQYTILCSLLPVLHNHLAHLQY